MSDRFQPITMEQLSAWVFDELERSGSIFGIPRDLFFVPAPSDRFATKLYGRRIETPVGVAAGPHTQMAQNIVTAWLCGARFIELKTVQTLDELNVSKPCIDMQDEGFNVEWSQELKIRQSLDEYVRAWVLIHALHRTLGFPGEAPGVVFNASVGYNLEGILKPNMQEYLKSLGNVSELKARYVEIVARHFPGVRGIPIPDRMSDNITLSTMHGCPPHEIEKISAYLVNDWGFHTTVKLNPTLLGPRALRSILNDTLGYGEVVVPDLAFEHDLKYADAIPMLHRLQDAAARKGVHFGVKLSNTLEVENHRAVFDPKEKMMYMSGRGLHAVTVNLAMRLAHEFNGELPMSFSAGADAFNVAGLFACGVKTVTVCSDLLKSGGYLRLRQYLDNLAKAITDAEAANLDEFVQCGGRAATNGRPRWAAATWEACATANLRHYSAEVLGERRYYKKEFDSSRTKTVRPLGPFDCIKAPCTDECPVDQQVPRYMKLVREGRFDEAVEVVREDNPLGAILGRACNHLCQQVCIRSHYDEPLAIREIKRFVMDHETKPHYRTKGPARGAKVAVIGGGPCGLSVAYFLGQAGYPVTIFEARAYLGGMVSGTIPAYRAAQAIVDQDLKIIRELGAEVRFNQRAGKDFTLAALRQQGFKYFVVAVGAQQGKKLGVPGEDSAGVLDALEFLRSVKENRPPPLGERIGVIGGGDVAMDCARSAARVSGRPVTIVYRRTVDQMPASKEEIDDALEEGVKVIELAKPLRVLSEGGRMTGLECLRMKLGEKDRSGRKRPVDIPNSEFTVPLETLIVAVSQEPALEFLRGESVEVQKDGYIKADPERFETAVPGVFAGGDIAIDGPESIVKALGDGRRIASAIRAKEEGVQKGTEPAVETFDLVDLMRRRATRKYRAEFPRLPPEERKGFEEVLLTLPEETAKEEAGRCLDCDRFCSLCVSVCPNRAFFTYRSQPFEAKLPGGKTFRVGQAFQVAVLNDFCNECGNCATFCPTAGKPYQDKPRLYLQHSEFEAESDNAFMVFRKNGTWSIKGRFGGETHEIEMGKEIVYRSPRGAVAFDPKSGSVPSEACATLFVLLRSLRDSMPHLPAR